VKGDMGKSAITGRPVILEIRSRFFNTVKLAVVATIVSSIFGIVLGPFSSLKREKPADYVIIVLSIFGISIPSFWLALC
jgi:ABC-type dipeptide/oligopeptide/nickel transport system permease component